MCAMPNQSKNKHIVNFTIPQNKLYIYVHYIYSIVVTFYAINSRYQQNRRCSSVDFDERDQT